MADEQRIREEHRYAKFVQIAVHPGGDTRGYEAIFALDDLGGVWWYDFDEEDWFMLSTKRSI